MAADPVTVEFKQEIVHRLAPGGEDADLPLLAGRVVARHELPVPDHFLNREGDLLPCFEVDQFLELLLIVGDDLDEPRESVLPRQADHEGVAGRIAGGEDLQGFPRAPDGVDALRTDVVFNPLGPLDNHLHADAAQVNRLEGELADIDAPDRAETRHEYLDCVGFVSLSAFARPAHEGHGRSFAGPVARCTIAPRRSTLYVREGKHRGGTQQLIIPAGRAASGSNPLGFSSVTCFS